jgi:hypothetical protein
MHRPTPINTAAVPTPNLINFSPLQRSFPVVVLALALGLFALSPATRAVDPPPDGGYPGNNTAEGNFALNSLTTGKFNTATGINALFANTTGGDNTATGANALHSNTTGNNNTANGGFALAQNTTGAGNTATGHEALARNTAGIRNTATGIQALQNNTASHNTATGSQALQNNTTGSSNTANGDGALYSNGVGSENTATGLEALFNNTTGSSNTANGEFALSNNRNGSFNVAEGNGALIHLLGGSSNVAIGAGAGSNLFRGSSNNVDISNFGVVGDSNTIRIGTVGTHNATFIAGIDGVTVPNGVGVIISSNGQLGTVQSSARFKEAIKPMDKASESILALKPVTFRYKHELDPDGIPQFGLVAEQVEKVNPDLVVRDKDGKVNTVRYEAVNAMLLNEFLKEHRKVEEQQATITRLESKVAKQELTATQQQKQIEALTATVRRVSDQIALK